ncbi:uncharacterized protein LOC127360411 [Dicentrarchus labrax]|uniref:uncharacterized protein LOC127360411 n=1 Tax=Dicentrarchus labrax TaxID=13489 RepID=UPI0021F5A3D8|nr:uncharacterized protein LOC127360411 [Dicentrarchus labrax]
MLVLVWLLILMMMMAMKSDAASAGIITAHSGETVLLTSNLKEVELKNISDVRWTHPQLVVSLKRNNTICPNRRCELLKDGSLRFSRVQTDDSGHYNMSLFDEEGNNMKMTYFRLVVEDRSSSSSSSRSVVVSVSMCCFLLLLFFVILFVVMRKRNLRMRTTTGSLHENVYVVMHGNHSNDKKEEEEKKQEKEEENLYVSCNPGVPMETPITQQMCVDDIYV